LPEGFRRVYSSQFQAFMVAADFWNIFCLFIREQSEQRDV